MSQNAITAHDISMVLSLMMILMLTFKMSFINRRISKLEQGVIYKHSDDAEGAGPSDSIH